MLTESIEFSTTALAADARVLEQLATDGYVIVPNFMSSEHCQRLYSYSLGLGPHQWQQAGIGRADSYTTNSAVRQDKIRWLSSEHLLEQRYLQLMERLRLALNGALFMGLFDYECHLAHYPPGAFYRKHLDAFKGRSNRLLSTVLYLNDDWQPQDGGELVIYGKHGQVLETILPQAGTLVVFLSDEFIHEVKAGRRDRYSITGWYRLNTSIGGVVDPTL